MTPEEFLIRLEGRLSGAGEREREKTLAFYGEMIAEMRESGKSDEEIIAGFDSPESIARQILDEERTEEKEPPKKSGGAARAVLYSTAIIWIPVLFAFIIAAGAIIFSFFATALAFAMVAVVAFVKIIVTQEEILLNVSALLFSLGAGTLIAIGTAELTKRFIEVITNLLKRRAIR